jgi:glycosyltransferase involved in cell wall biosynthesis
MNSIETVTVIIPVHNRFQLLAEALTSVQQQRLPVEIIVVDDGSTQSGLEEQLKQFEISSGLTVTLLRNSQPLGPATSRSQAIDFAHGKIIAFLDSDDFWDASFLQESLKVLAANATYGGVVCFSRPFFSGSFNLQKKLSIYAFNWIKTTLLMLSYITNRKCLWKSAPFLCQLSHNVFYKAALPPLDPSFAFAEDWKLALELMDSRPIAIVPKRLVHFRYTPNSYSFRQESHQKNLKASCYTRLYQAILQKNPNSLIAHLFGLYTKRFIVSN